MILKPYPDLPLIPSSIVVQDCVQQPHRDYRRIKREGIEGFEIVRKGEGGRRGWRKAGRGRLSRRSDLGFAALENPCAGLASLGGL